MRVIRITHAERAVLREEMAELIKHGSSVQEVCQEYTVTSGQVRLACEENGVIFPLCKYHLDNFKVLKSILDGVGYSIIAGRFKTSRQRVHQIAVQAREAGFKLPQDEAKDE